MVKIKIFSDTHTLRELITSRHIRNTKEISSDIKKNKFSNGNLDLQERMKSTRKYWEQEGTSTLATSIQCIGGNNQGNEARKRTAGIKIGKEELKLSSFSGNMTLFTEDPKEQANY